MTRRSIHKNTASLIARNFVATRFAAAYFAVAVCVATPISAQQPARDASPPPATQRRSGPANDETSARQAELEAAFVKMLSGATLEGSFTSTGRGSDPSKLRSEKYTIGEVKKLAAGVWLISARIQYGDHDVTLPVTVPIRWAGDTPVIVVDDQALPGFGTVSARVMFFADHYAGYWKHGDHGGHLFGIIHRDGEAEVEAETPNDSRDRSQSERTGANAPAER